MPQWTVTAVKEQHFEVEVYAQSAGEARTKVAGMIEGGQVAPEETVISELDAVRIHGGEP